jgi:hypothetical protein
MTKDDIDGVHKIESKVFSDPWSKQAFLADLKNDYAHPLVAYFENKVAGYARLSSKGDWHNANGTCPQPGI